MPAKIAKRPHPAAVYARTGKGVLSFKNGTAKVSGEAKDLFSCIDGKASVAELCAQLEMEAADLEPALDTLEKKGYVKVFREGGDQGVPDFTEAPDLDFTAPGSLLEISVREAAKAKADADAERRTPAQAAQLPVEPVQAPRDTTIAAAEAQPPAHAEAVRQREALEARIQDLEAEADALRRARNEAVKALGQAKRLAAEERAQAEEQARKLAEAEAQHPAAAVATGSMQEALAQAQETVAHVELQLATERETREQTVQALREAQSEAEAGRNAAEMRLKEKEIALQQAEKVDRQNRERLRQVEAQIETGRRARADAEGALEAERRTREALQAELAEAKLASERATAAASQHAERTAQVELEIDTERRARADAEAKASAERASREKTAQALLEVKRVIGLWKED